MTDKELEKKAEDFANKHDDDMLGVYDDDADLEYDRGYNRGYVIGLEEGYIAGAKEMQEETLKEIIEIEKVSDYRWEENQKLKQENEQLKIQFDKHLDFVADRVEECDVCELTDICINSEGLCLFARSNRNIKDLIKKHITNK